MCLHISINRFGSHYYIKSLLNYPATTILIIILLFRHTTCIVIKRIIYHFYFIINVYFCIFVSYAYGQILGSVGNSYKSKLFNK